MQTSFVYERQSLDALLAKGGTVKERDAAFRKLEKRARSSDEWLSILKRAYLSETIPVTSTKTKPPSSGDYDPGRSLQVAAAALKKIPQSANIVVAVAYVFMDKGLPERALELFSGRDPKILKLEPEQYPLLWAQSYLAALRAGKIKTEERSAGDAVRLARVLGDGRFLIDAAILALIHKDVFAAQSYIREASRLGVVVNAQFAWDSQLYAELSKQSDEEKTDSEIELLADSAYLVGNFGLAESRYEKVQASSWKNLSSLAALRLQTGEAKDNEVRELYEELFQKYGKEAPAFKNYVAHLARRGDSEEALKLLEGYLQNEGKSDTANNSLFLSMRLAIASLYLPENKIINEALRSVESNPDVGELRAVALRILLERARYTDFIHMFELGEQRGARYADHQFYAMVNALLHGDTEGALNFLAPTADEQGLLPYPSFDGPEKYYARAILLGEKKQFDKAQEAFDLALKKARSPRERASVLKGSGKLKELQGDHEGAQATFEAALLADPSDIEARLLAHPATETEKEK